MILALIGTLALVGGHPAAQEGSPAVVLEWSVREWALDPAARTDAIEAAARDADWKRRHGAFDALARAAPGSIIGEQERLARAALLDEHPNVRAQALAALAAHGREVGELTASLAEDPFPEVRRELARALGRLPWSEADRTLIALAEDVDPRVDLEATEQLLARIETASQNSQWRVWRTGRLHDDPETFLHVLEVLDRSASGPALGELVRKQQLSSSLPPGRRLLWSTLEFGAWIDVPSRLVEGWLEPLAPEHSPVERRRKARLLEWAGTLTGQAGLVLLHAATLEDERAREGNPDSAEAAQNASELLVAAVHALSGPDPTGDATGVDLRFRVTSLRSPGFRSWEWSDDFAIEFWDAVIGRAEGWDPADAAWLTPEVEAEVRAAAIDAFSDTWMRTFDRTSGELLVSALEDPEPDLAHGAWVTLAQSAEGVRDFGRPLYTWWVKQPLEVKLEALRHPSREVPLDTPWREELVRLWASGEGRHVSVIELLGAYVGDEEVEALLWRWLGQAIEVLEASPVPDEETTRGAWREVETMALWLTRSWMRLSGSGALRQRVELLERVGSLGKELGKALISDLAKREGGRAALRGLFDSPALSRRLRIEIVLVDRTIDDPRAFDLLFERYATCDQELRVRILLRLADLDEPRSRELLLAVALDGEAGPGARGLAIDSLTAAGTPAEVEPLLLRILAEGGDLDLERATIAALGSVGGEATEAKLHELLADPDQARYLRDVILPALARVEVRLGTAPSPRLVTILVEEAREDAGGELESRFRGERLSSRHFAYSGLIGGLEVFNRAGVLDRALELAGPWWRFDARLLLELGATVTESGGPAADALARRLNLAALIGLTGEGEAPDREGLIAKARARLLRIAWRARAWREAEGYATALLEDWRSGRTTRSGFEAAFGARDVEAGVDPTEWLIAGQLQARAWQALEAGRREVARNLASRALRRPNVSKLAREQQDQLEAALD